MTPFKKLVIAGLLSVTIALSGYVPRRPLMLLFTSHKRVGRGSITQVGRG